jgi:3-phosphoshikimate 1-carboxyvinyltransferase
LFSKTPSRKTQKQTPCGKFSRHFFLGVLAPLRELCFFMSLPDLLPIQPFTRPVRGSVVLPGSKSITNRALLLAALCDGPVTLTGALFSEDTEIMAEALRQLGFEVKENAAQKTIYVEGRRGEIPAEKATLHVGLAGTAARFLTALCAAAPSGVYRIDGVPQMRKRPMKGLFDALTSQGAKIAYLGEKGFFPIELHAHGLRGGEVEIDARESSQMLSALLMVAPLAASPLQIKLNGSVRWPFVEMTINQMAQFGFTAKLRHSENTIEVPCSSYVRSASYSIEPDATAASYFAALPLVVKGTVAIPDLAAPKQRLQGDTQFLTVLERVGAKISAESSSIQVGFGTNAKRLNVTQDFREFSDTFLTLAAIAPLLDGPTKITGIAHTRKQETDRVAGMARELKKLGQHVIEAEDSLEIHPRPLIPGVEIDTFGDHRFAMSFAVLGCYDLLGNGQPWLSIKNPACCAKTFPNFFDVLNELRTNSHLSQ